MGYERVVETGVSKSSPDSMKVTNSKPRSSSVEFTNLDTIKNEKYNLEIQQSQLNQMADTQSIQIAHTAAGSSLLRSNPPSSLNADGR
jgi:hypothetical protein